MELSVTPDVYTKWVKKRTSEDGLGLGKDKVDQCAQWTIKLGEGYRQGIVIIHLDVLTAALDWADPRPTGFSNRNKARRTLRSERKSARRLILSWQILQETHDGNATHARYLDTSAYI